MEMSRKLRSRTLRNFFYQYLFVPLQWSATSYQLLELNVERRLHITTVEVDPLACPIEPGATGVTVRLIWANQPKVREVYIASVTRSSRGGLCTTQEYMNLKRTCPASLLRPLLPLIGAGKDGMNELEQATIPATHLFRLLDFAKVPIRWEMNKYHDEEGRSEWSHIKEYQQLHSEFIEYGATNREPREPALAP